jgi:hypothetical protein
MSLSAKAQNAVKKKGGADAAIKKLEAELLAEEADQRTKFFARIDESFKQSDISDGRQVSYDVDIKTEFTSEFSLDKIAGVIVKSLNALAKTLDPTVPNPAMSPDAIEAYTGVVSAVAEAAKSSSNVSATLSYSMTRMGPGVYAFLFAKTESIRDEALFGTEAITSTAIFHRIMQSIDDLKNSEAFNAALYEYATITRWRAIALGFLEDVQNRKISMHEWAEMDSAARSQIAQAQRRLAKAGFDREPPKLMTAAPGLRLAGVPSETEVLIAAQVQARATLKSLRAAGPQFADLVAATEARLAAGEL